MKNKKILIFSTAAIVVSIIFYAAYKKQAQKNDPATDADYNALMEKIKKAEK